MRLFFSLCAVSFCLITGLLIHNGASQASWPSPARAASIALTPIDTGNRAEDEQPAYTHRLADAGWDYNPNCDDVNDWYPVGNPCNERS